MSKIWNWGAIVEDQASEIMQQLCQGDWSILMGSSETASCKRSTAETYAWSSCQLTMLSKHNFCWTYSRKQAYLSRSRASAQWSKGGNLVSCYVILSWLCNSLISSVGWSARLPDAERQLCKSAIYFRFLVVVEYQIDHLSEKQGSPESIYRNLHVRLQHKLEEAHIS